MKHYQKYKGAVEINLNGEVYTISVPEYVESLSERLGGNDSSKLLNFISCLDAYQEDVEFTKQLALTTTNNFVEWLLAAEIPKDEPIFFQQVITHYESVVTLLKENKL